MKILLRLLFGACLALSFGCGGGAPVSDAGSPPTPAPIAKPDFPDPPAEVAAEVEQTIRDWVAQRADENGLYAIAPRGGSSVSGTLDEFHAVHQNDADTYTVCVDFVDGDSLYDVDFFVDRGADGLIVRDGFLHKVDGEVISG
jgi:hypothetical protein